MKRYVIIILTFLLTLMIFTGCAAKKDAALTEQAAKGSEEKKTRIIKHFKGETEVPANPKRVVSIMYTGQVLALGVKPVGVRDFDLQNHYMKEKLQGVESIGDGANLEKILALQPDLIIASDGEEKIYEDLKKIAPTVLIPWMGQDVEGHLKLVSEVLGREKEAEAWVTKFNTRSKELREALKKNIKEEETVLIFRIYPDSFSVYGDRNMGHVFYRGLGLKPPALVGEEIKKKPGSMNEKQVSLEVLPDYKSDHMIVMVNNLKDAEKQLKEIQSMELWKNLPAVKNNKVYYIERNQWLSYDPISIQGQLEDAIKLFEKKQ